MTDTVPHFASPKLAGAGTVAGPVLAGLPPNFQQVAVKQLMLNWCWAAVGSAVRFCADQPVLLPQCEVGNRVKYHLFSDAAEALDWCADRQSDSKPRAMNQQGGMVTVLQEIGVPLQSEANWPCYARIRAWVSVPSQVCPLLVRLPGDIQHFILAVGTTPEGLVIYDPSERMEGSRHVVVRSEAEVARYGDGQCLTAYFV